MKPERVIIVDEHDNVIGDMPRADRTYADIYRVSCLWLTNPRGHVLLAQRKFTKDRGAGLWGPAVAGTVQLGETYETNIYKEAAEEIGVTGVQFQIGPKVFVDSGRYRCFSQFFTVVLDWPLERFQIQEEEVEQIVWSEPHQLLAELKSNPGKFVSSAPQWPALFL